MSQPSDLDVCRTLLDIIDEMNEERQETKIEEAMSDAYGATTATEDCNIWLQPGTDLAPGQLWSTEDRRSKVYLLVDQGGCISEKASEGRLS